MSGIIQATNTFAWRKVSRGDRYVGPVLTRPTAIGNDNYQLVQKYYHVVEQREFWVLVDVIDAPIKKLPEEPDERDIVDISKEDLEPLPEKPKKKKTVTSKKS